MVLLEDFADSDSEFKYHKNVKLPPNVVRDFAGYLTQLPSHLTQSEHWKKERWWKHQYTNISKTELLPKDAFEFAYKGGVLQKVAFRVTHLDPEDDIIYVVSREGKVVTTWPNKKTDPHKTLDRNKYQRSWPPKELKPERFSF